MPRVSWAWTRIFIAADIEGCTGVVHLDQLMEGQPRYQAARTLMTADINAAIAGARSVGPEATFIVCDGHASMRNIILEELDPAAELAETVSPGYQFVATKRTLGPTAALCKVPARTRREIAEAASEAVRAFGKKSQPVRQFGPCVTMTVHAHCSDFVRKALASSDIHRLDDYTFEAKDIDPAECFRKIWHGIYLGLLQAPEWLT